MIIKIKDFRELFRSVITLAPVELGGAVIFFLVATVTYRPEARISDWLWSFPACFSLIYAVNRFTHLTSVRWLYYLSGLSVAGFWWWELSPDGSMFWITLIVSQLLVSLTVKQKDNVSFVENVLCYVRDMSGALLLAFLGWLLSWAIYGSVVYIFDLSFHDWSFSAYSLQTAGFLVAPLIFLMFNARGKGRFGVNAFFRVLINFIVSPALLIYNLILYIYFIKIAVEWSLPKGGIAYMVLSFIALLTITKSWQLVLSRRYYDWYYRYFSFWVLPPLVMLWISVLYRIEEYGWTEWRVYLMLTTLVATMTMILFFTSRWGKYKWISIMAMGILFLFTYFPGINAKVLGLRSQENRIQNALDFLYSKEDGTWREDTDTLTLENYKVLYNSSLYVERAKDTAYMKKHFGITWGDLDHLIPEKAMTWIDGYDRGGIQTVLLSYWEDKIFDIRNFDSLQMVSPYQNENEVYSEMNDGWLSVYRQKDTLVHMDLNPVFRKRLVENGIDIITQEKLEKVKELFRVYDQGNKRIILGNIQINPDDLSVEDVSLRFLLIRKE